MTAPRSSKGGGDKENLIPSSLTTPRRSSRLQPSISPSPSTSASARKPKAVLAAVPGIVLEENDEDASESSDVVIVYELSVKDKERRRREKGKERERKVDDDEVEPGARIDPVQEAGAIEDDMEPFPCADYTLQLDPVSAELPFSPKYRLLVVESRLGQGGFGAVFRATAGDGEIVAIKTLRANTPRNRAHFLAECAAQRLCASPHVLPVLALGFWKPSLSLCMIMPAASCTLADVLRDVQVLEKQMGVFGSDTRLRDPLLGWYLELGQGTIHIHAQGLAHRDLKPANLLLVRMDDNTLHLVICDFGFFCSGDGPTSAALPEALSNRRRNHAGTAPHFGRALMLEHVWTSMHHAYLRMEPPERSALEALDALGLGLKLWDKLDRKEDPRLQDLWALCVIVHEIVNPTHRILTLKRWSDELRFMNVNGDGGRGLRRALEAVEELVRIHPQLNNESIPDVPSRLEAIEPEPDWLYWVSALVLKAYCDYPPDNFEPEHLFGGDDAIANQLLPHATDGWSLLHAPLPRNASSLLQNVFPCLPPPPALGARRSHPDSQRDSRRTSSLSTDTELSHSMAYNVSLRVAQMRISSPAKSDFGAAETDTKSLQGDLNSAILAIAQRLKEGKDEDSVENGLPGQGSSEESSFGDRQASPRPGRAGAVVSGSAGKAGKGKARIDQEEDGSDEEEQGSRIGGGSDSEDVRQSGIAPSPPQQQQQPLPLLRVLRPAPLLVAQPPLTPPRLGQLVDAARSPPRLGPLAPPPPPLAQHAQIAQPRPTPLTTDLVLESAEGQGGPPPAAQALPIQQLSQSPLHASSSDQGWLTVAHHRCCHCSGTSELHW